MRTDYYELLYIIPLQYAGEFLQPTVDEVEEKLKSIGADVHLHEQFGKLKFAYKMKQHYQGFYYLVEFTLSKDKVQDLHSWLQLKKEILRFIIVKKDPTKKSSLDLVKDKLGDIFKNDQDIDKNVDNVEQENREVNLKEIKEEEVIKDEKKDEKHETDNDKKSVKQDKEEKTKDLEKLNKKNDVVKKEDDHQEIEDNKEDNDKEQKSKGKKDKKEEKLSLEDLDKKLDEILESDLPTI